ncbi:hypothetical protein [Bradyrhizobium sp. BRP22]|uniref:hypothetical protein n=1 Tax=Bradyrhizobium sp. BRP22 TaxID=2793821 RepID=UPI00201BB7AC|nr:hypothetical protein [Bradyrhizobium sp. BRP22]
MPITTRSPRRSALRQRAILRHDHRLFRQVTQRKPLAPRQCMAATHIGPVARPRERQAVELLIDHRIGHDGDIDGAFMQTLHGQRPTHQRELDLNTRVECRIAGDHGHGRTRCIGNDAQMSRGDIAVIGDFFFDQLFQRAQPIRDHEQFTTGARQLQSIATTNEQLGAHGALEICDMLRHR